MTYGLRARVCAWQAAVGYMGEINATAKNDIVKDFRNRNDEMLAKTVKVSHINLLLCVYMRVIVYFCLGGGGRGVDFVQRTEL